MKNDELILAVLVLLGVAGVGVGKMVVSSKRGIRNNNPANIRHGEPWLGRKEVQGDPEFIQFIAPEYGLRAMYRTLMTYRNKYGLNTIRGIVERWAPKNGIRPDGSTYTNPTAAYIKFVSESSSISPDAVLSLTDYPRVMKSIIKFENGIQPYSDLQIKNGIALS